MNWVRNPLRKFLGKPVPICRTSTKAFAARVRLSIEELETRSMPATILPAPSAALAPHPADNPALPSAFDVFNPPIATLSIAAQAPQLATLTDQGNPDDSLAVAGYQFSTLVGPNAGQDTVFQTYGQTTSGNGTLTPATVQELNGDRAVVTLGANLPARSMYLVWAQNAAGASLPFAVNKATAWWVGPNTASPGSTVSIYGENLSNGASTPSSWIYLQPTQGQGQWINPSAVNPYKVDFTVPAGLAAGSYQLWVHNGHGGAYGWSSPVTLTVQAAYNYTGKVVSLASFPGGLPNTGVDATAAIQAALAAIGNNTGTIILQAGTYYVGGSPSNLVGGFGKGIYLQGAGKNSTIIKALPGFSGQYLFTLGAFGKVSDMTVDTTGANVTQSALSCNDIENVKIICRGNINVRNISTTNLDLFIMKNCDLIGPGIFLGLCDQVFITGCNFYGTDQIDDLVNVWSGDGISITNCTAQDFNVNSSDPNDHCAGRFFVGTGIWGNQSDVYIADNRTISLAPTPTFYNQNSGEQILWEGNSSGQSTMVLSATANTATLASLTSNWASNGEFEAVVVGGKGAGQHRTITSTDFSSGGTTLTLDRPWDIIPDATARINIVTTNKRIAVYHNTLQGNYNMNSASCGVEPYQGGFEIRIDSNTISAMHYGISDFSYEFVSAGWCAQPLFGTLIQNNVITTSDYGMRTIDWGNRYGEPLTHMANVYRNNTMSSINKVGWYMESDVGGTDDLDIFEHNHIADAPTAIAMVQLATGGQDNLTLYKNTLNRGAAPLANSQALTTQPGFTIALSGNTILNFLAPQGPTGTLYTRLPTFSWNPIPGASQYYVWVQDLSTGQSPVLSNSSISGTNWAATTALPSNHAYRWWVEALGPTGAVSNWSASQDFYVSALGQALPIGPIGASTFLSAASLTPTFSWTAVGAADSYDIWVNDITTGQAQVLRRTTTSTALTSSTALTIGHQYQWWVRALNNSGNAGPWCSGIMFSSTIAPPVPVGPTAALISTAPTFTWNPAAGADYYDVWVDDVTSGQTQVLRTPLSGPQIVTGSTWTAPSQLRPGDTYKWWTRAVSNAGTSSAWSAGTSFAVALLTAPTPLPPPDSAFFNGLYLNWSPINGADYYDVWLDDVTTATSQFVRNTHVTVTNLPVPNAVVGHVYQWWVRALSNGGNYSPWSTLTRITLLAPPTPTGPGSTALSASLTLSWLPVVGADFYDVWIVDNSTFANAFRNTNVSGLSLSVTSLTAGHTYNWWVRARSNSGNYGIWSQLQSFTLS